MGGDGPTGIGTVIAPVDPTMSVRENTDRLCGELLECTNRYAGVLSLGTVVGCLELHKLHVAAGDVEDELASLKMKSEPPKPTSAPPRPRLFTTAEKDDFVGGCDSGGIKVFPNEISRGWWTIAMNGQPIPEESKQ